MRTLDFPSRLIASGFALRQLGLVNIKVFDWLWQSCAWCHLISPSLIIALSHKSHSSKAISPSHNVISNIWTWLLFILFTSISCSFSQVVIIDIVETLSSHSFKLNESFFFFFTPPPKKNMIAYTSSKRTHFVCTEHHDAAANMAWLWGVNIKPSKPGNCYRLPQ